MVQPATFWNRMARRYARSPIADEDTYQKKLTITQEFLRPDMQVLEFGCGTGSTALVHAPHVANIQAIDISSGMIEIAQEKLAGTAHDNVTFSVATLDDLEADPGSFDAILGLSILHLLPDLDATMTQVSGLLKPGGVFVSSTACLGDALGFFRFIGPIGEFIGVLPHLNIFTTEHLVQRMTAADLHIEQQWQPGKNKGVFIVARKTTDTATH